MTRHRPLVACLSKNLSPAILGGEGLIKKGYDPDSGMAFYQLYFKEEEH